MRSSSTLLYTLLVLGCGVGFFLGQDLGQSQLRSCLLLQSYTKGASGSCYEAFPRILAMACSGLMGMLVLLFQFILHLLS